MSKVVLTREGYEKLIKELNFLKTTKRVEVAKQLEEARAHGDLRENAEYDAAKQAKSQLETRIHILEEKLTRVKIVDPSEMQHDKIFLGAFMKVQNLDTQETFPYKLVSQDEADFSQGKISVTSPIGKGLLGKKAGETVEIKVPSGVVKLKILEIRYE